MDVEFFFNLYNSGGYYERSSILPWIQDTYKTQVYWKLCIIILLGFGLLRGLNDTLV